MQYVCCCAVYCVVAVGPEMRFRLVVLHVGREIGVVKSDGTGIAASSIVFQC